MDLKEEEALGEAIHSHWYYTAKARTMARHLPEKLEHVLDVGAGSGWFTRWLLNNSPAARGTCVDTGYAEDRGETVSGKPLAFVRSIDNIDAGLVLMMDVLEHVDDDVGLLSDYLDKVPEGTPVFITVPAFEFLWSAHDDYLEHRRRYTLASLEKTVRSAGAEPVAMHYYFASVLPIAMLVRLLRRGSDASASDMKPQPGWINAVLRSVCAFERLWMRANRLAGLSCVCVCKR